MVLNWLAKHVCVVIAALLTAAGLMLWVCSKIAGSPACYGTP